MTYGSDRPVVPAPSPARRPAGPAPGGAPGQGVLIVGTGAAARAMADAIRARPDSRLDLLGFVATAAAPGAWHPAARPVVGHVARLPGLVRRLRPSTLLVESLNTRHAPPLLDCMAAGAAVRTFASVYEQLDARVALPAIDDAWCLAALAAPGSRAAARTKRALDVALAVLGLGLTAAAWPAIALAIRVAGGPGPVLFRQRRVGLGGRTFWMYKFRTMTLDAEQDGATWAAVGDARVTPAGRFLRLSRLDELPQFWNVLAGDMSLVGPRPERPEFVRLLAREIPYYGLRHLVLPGVTGWAQVRLPYGASVDDAREKLQYDLYYVKNRSTWLDLRIMWRTVGVMARKFGAR